MNIIVVEDDIADISGYLELIKSKEWRFQKFRTFSDIYDFLAEGQEKIDLFLIDIMLPWGTKVPKETSLKFSWKQAGLFLIYAIRNIEDEKLRVIKSSSMLAEELPKQYRNIPIIVLSKVLGTVADELSNIDGVFPISKLSGRSGKEFISFLQDVVSR